jgi:hypothetical protein
MASTIAITGSPFVELPSFEQEAPRANGSNGHMRSPFVEALRSEDAYQSDEYAERRLLVAELYDEEMDEAIYELMNEAAAMAGDGTPSRFTANTLAMRFGPMAEEIESTLQRLADEFGTRSPDTIPEEELDEVLARIAPEQELSPAFEQFWGSIKKAVKRVAKGAVKLAKKGIKAATALGLGPILNRLKALVRPLLQRVLTAAISRLPVAVQPAARKLAAKLPSLLRLEVDPADGMEPAALDVSEIQLEFDEQIAGYLLGETEPDLEQEEPSWDAEAWEAELDIADLDAARERFAAELASLGDGEDPAPAVERFVPALLPVLKLGLRIAGRKRVVSLLGGLVSKLIARFVGPSSARALSVALVDAGLKLIGLEVADTEPSRAATDAVVATVEETVRAVSALPDAVLDDEVLLEGAVLNAFERAATSNFPPLLSNEVYRQRPDLIETDAERGSWIPCPRGKPRFKKYSRVMRTRITPHAALAIPVAGNAPLANYLQDQLGLEAGDEIEAEVHLYEAMPGMLLGDVARFEANGGEGTLSSDEFHPLTTEAAALLTGEPGLAGEAPRTASAARSLGAGRRFFRIAVPGQRVAARPGRRAKRSRRRPTSLHAVFDFPGDRIRLHLYLAERRAQELAATLRKGGHAGVVALSLKGLIDRGLTAATTGNITGRLKLLHEALELHEARGSALRRLPAPAVQAMNARIGEWSLSALGTFFTKYAARLVAATENAANGVTLTITIANPPGLSALHKALSGAPATADSGARGTPPSTEVTVSPGFTNG